MAIKKTNLDILDQDIWNEIKSKKNEFELRSVADYIFKVIKGYQTMNIEKCFLLINLEKYYEYDYFDLGEFANAIELKLDKIIKLVDKYLGSEIPLFSFQQKEIVEKKILKKIHDQMIDCRILPRELSIIYKLMSFIDKNQLDISKYANDVKTNKLDVNLNNEKILSILFPDSEELRKEIYSGTIKSAEMFIEMKEYKDFECANCNQNCVVKKPDFVYYKSGVNVSLDDIKDDLISEILKKNIHNGFLACYGFCLIGAINALIKKNLIMVKNFIRDDLYLFKEQAEITIFFDALIDLSKKESLSLLTCKEKDNQFESISENFFEKLTTISSI